MANLSKLCLFMDTKKFHFHQIHFSPLQEQNDFHIVFFSFKNCCSSDNQWGREMDFEQIECKSCTTRIKSHQSEGLFLK